MLRTYSNWFNIWEINVYGLSIVDAYGKGAQLNIYIYIYIYIHINFIVLVNLYAFFHFCLLSIISSLLRSIIPPSLYAFSFWIIDLLLLLIYCCPLYNFFPRNSELFLFVLIYGRILTLWRGAHIVLNHKKIWFPHFFWSCMQAKQLE